MSCWRKLRAPDTTRYDVYYTYLGYSTSGLGSMLLLVCWIRTVDPTPFVILPRGGSASQQLPSVVDPATLYVFECAADWIDGKQLPNVVCGFVGQLQLWAKMAERILYCFLLVHCLENMQLPVQWLTWLIHSCFFPRLGSNSVSKRSARGASASHFLCSFLGNLFNDLFRSQTSLIYQFRRLQESGPLQRQNCLCSLIWFSWFSNYSAHLSTWFLWW